MSKEDAQTMADEMLLRLGSQLGLDPEALRNAPKKERKAMIGRAGEGFLGAAQGQMENMLGMPLEDIENLSPQDIMAVMMGAAGQGSTPPIPPSPLLDAPSRGFPDGALPWPIPADFVAELSVEEPSNVEMLVVLADTARREIVWRETRTAPFQERLSLLDIAPDPGALVLELIDPSTHRVIRRYRPVAAPE
jgi:hypothetical protein